MLRYSIAMVGAFVVPLSLGGCGSDASSPNKGTQTVSAEFSTPEEAILGLESAYRARDLEAAVRCKDFRIEARLMLEKLNLPKPQIDEELVSKTAEVLELAFRKELKDKGFPDMTGVRSTFLKQEPGGENVVIVTEVCQYPDGGASTQRLLVAKTEKGWRVLNPIE